MCVVLFSFTANATLIKVDLDKEVYQVGETITAKIIVEGRQAFDPTYLVSGFSANLLTDSSLLTFLNNQFGSKLNDYVPAVWFIGDQKFSYNDGQINILEASELGVPLLSLQGYQTSLLLATIEFEAFKSGSGSFTINQASVNDEIGFGYLDTRIGAPALFTIESSVQVPEPSTLALFSVLALMVLRRRA